MARNFSRPDFPKQCSARHAYERSGGISINKSFGDVWRLG
jgi:hypothetical protein